VSAPPRDPQPGEARAVVFDLDGVLVDSEGLWDGIRRDLAAEAGRPWPDDATRAMMGMSTPEWSGYLAETVGVPGTPEELARTVIDRMAGHYAESLPLLPGAVEAVRRTGERWPLGLASSSPRLLIDAVLEAADLTGAFRVTVSTEEVSAGKPSPEVYQTAVARLGVEPAAAVAVEDSTNGIRAAAAAGMAVIAVPHDGFPPAPDALALADVHLGSLADLSAEAVEAAARRRPYRERRTAPPEA
jgi:HAD superfamily hydrolase (TIGR01509 family)